MGTKIKKYNLKQLIEFIESKHVAVPEFQRGFVWKNSQVKKLFDSLINQYPVGSFILWDTNKNIDARTLDGEKLSKRKFLILDGQQRMVSIYYLCRQRKFVEPHVKDKFHETCDNRERNIIDFEKFYIGKNSDGRILEYSKDHSCKLDFKQFRSLVKDGYKFPVITISLDNYRRAIEVFERINQAGTRISTESIFLSETWNVNSNIGKILRTWKKRNKGSLTSGIDTVIFIHVFALISQLDEKEQDENIEIGIQTLKKIAEKARGESGDRCGRIFSDVIEAVARAVEYLKEQYKVVALRELPSQTMITVLSVFFYYQKKSLSLTQLKQLRKWFWRSSLDNRYIGSGYSENIGKDARQMRDLAQRNAGLNIPFVTSKLFAKIKDVDMRIGRSTYRNIVKQALWLQKPVFINGVDVSRNDVESGQHKPEDDHFFPFNWSQKGLIGQDINNICNIHFLNGDENSRKGGKLPSKWLQERIDEIRPKQKDVKKYFESQLLPFESQKDLKKYEKAFGLKGKARQKECARQYDKFLRNRFKLFEKVLAGLQNGQEK